MSDGRIVSPEDIVSFQNGTGSTITANKVVMRDSTTTEGIKLPTAVTDQCVGVTMRDIPTGEYGPLQRAGRAYVTAGAAMATAGVEVMPTTAGKVIAWTASADDNAFSIGSIVGTASADGDTVLIDLNLHFHQG